MYLNYHGLASGIYKECSNSIIRKPNLSSTIGNRPELKLYQRIYTNGK